jgi:hypothetical protein
VNKRFIVPVSMSLLGNASLSWAQEPATTEAAIPADRAPAAPAPVAPAAPPAPPAPVTTQVPSPAPPPPAGQWVYTAQYGWLWLPYAQTYTYVYPDSDVAYAYAYYPAYGWRWVTAPWVFGVGPAPYWGVRGRVGFAWYAHPWFHSTVVVHGGAYRGRAYHSPAHAAHPSHWGGYHGGGGHGHR